MVLLQLGHQVVIHLAQLLGLSQLLIRRRRPQGEKLGIAIQLLRAHQIDLLVVGIQLVVPMQQAAGRVTVPVKDREFHRMPLLLMF